MFIITDTVIFRAINEHYHIGILLNRTRFPKVTQLRNLTFITGTRFYRTAQLRQGNDRDTQLLGQSFQLSRYFGDLLLTVTAITGTMHQL
ncbi:hypothetical protein D3C72_922550 [compost metagenome]